jgi:hypothetical protein
MIRRDSVHVNAQKCVTLRHFVGVLQNVLQNQRVFRPIQAPRRPRSGLRQTICYRPQGHVDQLRHGAARSAHAAASSPWHSNRDHRRGIGLNVRADLVNDVLGTALGNPLFSWLDRITESTHYTESPSALPIVFVDCVDCVQGVTSENHP